MKYFLQSAALTASLMFFLAITPHALAQNLVPNASFEQVSDETREKDIKAFGLVNVHSQEWSGATEVSPDLFMVREKESKVTIPCNDYGHQDPADGSFTLAFVPTARAPSSSVRTSRFN